MSPFEALKAKHDFASVTAESLDAFLAASGETVLFFPGDRERLAESDDVAVILPELLKQFGGRLTPALVDKASERALQRRFCFNAFPALVFLRGDGYLGVITRLLDWRGYIVEIAEILAREPSAPPPFELPGACGAHNGVHQ